jgi:uncharacterized protein YndB with AHSA1/START domain
MTDPQKPMLSLQRTYEATPEELWELWTTKGGIESWWGPDGFAVEVQELDLRVGGELLYTMTAVEPGIVEFMRSQNMPISNQTRNTFTEVLPARRLAFTTRADFIPGVEPYDVATLLELDPAATGTRLTLHFEAMHDEEWTARSQAGEESQLEKLERMLAARQPR